MNDDLLERYHAARREMIDAFAELTTLALRAGASRDDITEIHGRFFDGNVGMKREFNLVAALAWIRSGP